MTTPKCPSCGAKFQHDQIKMECRSCGIKDEVLLKGRKAVLRWQKASGLTVSRGGSSTRRKRAHGRPRGARKRVS